MANVEVSRELVFTGADLARPRMVVEQEKMRAKFPGFQFYGSGGNVSSVQGYLTTSDRNRYYVKVIVSSSYPYALPTIELPQHAIDSDCPHKYMSGAICVMKSEQWSSTYSLAFVVARAAVWLNKYDLWRRTGRVRWPGNDQHR